MELHDVHISKVQKINGDVTSSSRIDKCFRFYRAKFHLFSIPIGIILAIVHLKYGIQYLGQCPIQPNINIYMIVHASTTLLVVAIATIGVLDTCYMDSRSEDSSNKTLARHIIVIVVILSLILLLFNLAWLITGSVWIFGAKSNGVQGSDPTATTTYCQSDLYRAAFILIILNYIFHIVIISMVIIKRTCCKNSDPPPPFPGATNRI